MFFRDRTATIIFGALLLNADVASLVLIAQPAFRVENAHNDQIKVAATFFFAFASATAVSCSFMSIWHALLVVRFGRHVRFAIREIESVARITVCGFTFRNLANPKAYILTSAWSTICGVCLLVYLFQGMQSFIAAVVPLFLVVRSNVVFSSSRPRLALLSHHSGTHSAHAP